MNSPKYKVADIRKAMALTFDKDHRYTWCLQNIPSYAKLLKDTMNNVKDAGDLIIDGGWSKTDVNKFKQNLNKK